jgi:hypothetical protein
MQGWRRPLLALTPLGWVISLFPPASAPQEPAFPLKTGALGTPFRTPIGKNSESPKVHLLLSRNHENSELRNEAGIKKSHKIDTISLMHVAHGRRQTTLSTSLLERGTGSSKT